MKLQILTNTILPISKKIFTFKEYLINFLFPENLSIKPILNCGTLSSPEKLCFILQRKSFMSSFYKSCISSIIKNLHNFHGIQYFQKTEIISFIIIALKTHFHISFLFYFSFCFVFFFFVYFHFSFSNILLDFRR
jgi:hypothetical protein